MRRGSRPGPTMTCSICGTPFGPLQVGPVAVDRCPKCGSLWFDRSELSAAIRHQASGVDPGWGVPGRATGHSNPPTCPRDPEVRLDPYRWGKVNFWRCPKCRGALLRTTDWQEVLASAESGTVSPAGDRLAQYILVLLG